MSKIIFITGASSGLGACLARELAKRGHPLGLFARRADLLEQQAEELRQHYGVRVETARLDVCEQESVAAIINDVKTRLGGLDIMVANAGVIGARKSGDGKLGTDRRVIETNLLGAIATLDAAVAIFQEQGHGQLVGISSLSAYCGIPGSAAYSASKAALSNYLEAQRLELGPRGIKVTIVHPGFIRTEIAPGMDKYPFVAEPEKVAKEISDAIARETKNAIVPRWPWAVLLPTLRFVPDGILRKIF